MIEKWCEHNGLQLNKAKSAVMRIRVDKRTKIMSGDIRGISFVTQYKYLGVVVDDDLSY